MRWSLLNPWVRVAILLASWCCLGSALAQDSAAEAVVRAQPFSPHYLRIGATAFVSGPYEYWYMRVFEGLQAGVDRVVFVNANSRRHDKLGAAQFVAGQLRRKQATTVVIGRCDTFCSIAFMGGVERLFGQDLPGEKTRLDVRALMNYDTRVLETRFPDSEFAPMVKMEPRLNENKALWLDAFGKVTDASGSLLVEADGASFCASRTAQKGCKTHEGVTAASLGVVTSEQRVVLTLPTMFPAPDIASDVKVTDLDALPVKDEAVRKAYQDFFKLPAPRAFALPSTVKPDARAAFSLAGMPDAAAQALYVCYQETGAICRLYAVDSDVVWHAQP